MRSTGRASCALYTYYGYAYYGYTYHAYCGDYGYAYYCYTRYVCAYHG